MVMMMKVCLSSCLSSRLSAALLANGNRDSSRFPGSSRCSLDDQELVSRRKSSGRSCREVSIYCHYILYTMYITYHIRAYHITYHTSPVSFPVCLSCGMCLSRSVSPPICLFLSIAQREYIPAPSSDDSREPSKELWSVYSRSDNQIPEHQPSAHDTCSGTITDIGSFIQHRRHHCPTLNLCPSGETSRGHR